METLEQLSRALGSLDELRGIVRTMKALSAANIRQYEMAVESLRQYGRTVDLGLHVVLRDMPPPAPDSAARRHGPVGVIVFGSDHGLCGRFNEDVAAFVRDHLRTPGIVVTRVAVVGARVAPMLADAGLAVDQHLALPGTAARITALVDRLLLVIDDWRATDAARDVHLVFNQRRSRARTHPAAQRLLPVDFRRLRRLEDAPWPSRVLPTFTLPRDVLFAALVRQYLFVNLFRACAESLAAEHASRVAAMQGAARNLDERHADWLGRFRRRRQAAITAEILDIVSGYEASRPRERGSSHGQA